MSGELAVMYVLSNNAGYYALVGGSAAAARIYYDELNQNSTFPQASITSEAVDPSPTKQNSNFDHDLIQIFHSAPTKTMAVQMATMARTALEAASGTINGINVNEIRFVDSDSFTEKIVNNKIYTVEQRYRVTINL